MNHKKLIELLELVRDYYDKRITSQKLISEIVITEVDPKDLYMMYHGMDNIICPRCKRDMTYTGFKFGIRCSYSCESKKNIHLMTDEEIIDTVKQRYIDLGGFTRVFGLEFKKYEERLSPLFFNTTGGELKYCVINNINKKPICRLCDNECHFSITKYKYSSGCKQHIMSLENHKWSAESKTKMINSCKETRARNLSDDPEYYAETSLKLSEIKRSYSDEKKQSIQIKRIDTVTRLYGVDNISKLDNIKQKKKVTLYKNYNVTTVWKLPRVIDSIRNTNILRGYWLSDEDKSLKSLYYRAVWRVTNKQQLNTLPNFNMRGAAYKSRDAHHLDHQYSISAGCKLNILPLYVGNINNLKMIPALENIYKGAKCTLTIDELCASIVR